MTARHPLLGKRVRFVKRGVLGYATRQYTLPYSKVGHSHLCENLSVKADLIFLQFTSDSGEVHWLTDADLEGVIPHCPAEIEELIACCPAKP